VSAFAAFAVALVVALLVTPLAARLARRFDVVDRPGPLKVQRDAVPYLGGVAVCIALAGPIAVIRPSLLAPLALLLALGLADDLGDLEPRLRLLLELGIGLVGGVVAPAAGGALGVLVTAAFVVGLVNAVNLLDGLDGLAGGVAFASAIGFAVVDGPARLPALALAGALGGFLVFNRPPARIYLGDSGAYMIGGALALLAGLAIGGGGAGSSAAAWAAIPLLVALPVFDTAIAIVRRRRAGRPLFGGDRSHVYDQLVDRGQTRSQAVLECIAAQALLTAVGVFAIHLRAGWAIVAATACVAALVVVATWGGFISRRSEPSQS
jgi:UDP-GlcNAc:undecaprenyl-phosphate GlcNAc-1-phosphate transferase